MLSHEIILCEIDQPPLPYGNVLGNLLPPQGWDFNDCVKTSWHNTFFIEWILYIS